MTVAFHSESSGLANNNNVDFILQPGGLALLHNPYLGYLERPVAQRENEMELLVQYCDLQDLYMAQYRE